MLCIDMTGEGPGKAVPLLKKMGLRMSSKNSIIDEIARLASNHKIVPFIGAGVSVNHLNLDWGSLTKEMSKQISTIETDNLIVAEEYVMQKGMDDFCNFLKGKLIIDEFDDNKGISHLAIISLGIRLIYTTNQDNVLELCAEKYGRKYNKIVELILQRHFFIDI